MISNKLRPYVSGWKIVLILIYLKLFHKADGWKYYFSSFDNFRFDKGQIQFSGNNWVENNVLLHCSGGDIKIGKRTFINKGSIIVSKKLITIGNDVLIADYVSIYDHDHKFNNKSTEYEQNGYDSSNVSIDDNVWIGTHSVILKGVHIGKNSIVAAGSVVTKDIPSNELWGGAPARHIKNIT